MLRDKLVDAKVGAVVGSDALVRTKFEDNITIEETRFGQILGTMERNLEPTASSRTCCWLTSPEPNGCHHVTVKRWCAFLVSRTLGSCQLQGLPLLPIVHRQ